jgi:alpha-tubulin suppressor-like RCC1 family protein
MKNRIRIYPLLFTGLVIVYLHGCAKDDQTYGPVSGIYTAVSAGGNHTLALGDDGSLWAWGCNGSGQLGDGTNTTRIRPVLIDTGYSAISAGYSHSIGLKTDGTLWTWGYNQQGQLGDGTLIDKNIPVQIGSNYKAISAGKFGLYGEHSLALKTDGTLWAWGYNQRGQLGDGTLVDRTIPVKIGTGFTAISAGGEHSLALKANGTLWAWGFNFYGQLGDNSTNDKKSPVQIGSDFVAIAAGVIHSLGIKSDQTLWAWGNGMTGQLGDSTTETVRDKPVKIGSGFSAISTGGSGLFPIFNCAGSHCLAIKTDGTVWTWGYNCDGQLGDGNTNNIHVVPTQIVSPLITNPSLFSISAGGSHSVLLALDGTLWAWGDNACGQFGDGTTTGKLIPTHIGGG